jgi:release factor glutamine methyltransferase
MTTPDEPWTIGRLLMWTIDYLQKHGADSPRLDAEVLLAHARGCKRIELYTHFDETVPDDERAAMRELVQRRAKSEPVAYLVGGREFFSLELRVTPDVLIPRADTETLVVELLEQAKGIDSPRILDAGTGSGAIAVAAAVHLPSARVTAIDLSAGALAVARENAEMHNVADRIRFLHGDLFGPLNNGEQFELIASNPPYVRADEIDSLPPDVRLHEPLSALAAGPEGLDVIARLSADAPPFLVPGGRLLMEISPRQSAAVTRMLQSHGAYEDVRGVKDLSGGVRVMAARRRA